LSTGPNSVSEASAGAVIGTLSASDLDSGDTLTYSVSGAYSSYVEVVSGNTLKLKSGVALDYESKNAYSLTLNVSDGTSTTSVETIINVTNIHAPEAANYLDKGTVFYSNALSPSSVVEPIFTGGRWSTLGKGVDLSYSFANYAYFLADYDWDGSPYDVEVTDKLWSNSDAFKTSVRNSLQFYSNVSLLTFSEVIESVSANGQLRIGSYDSSSARDAILSFPPVGSGSTPTHYNRTVMDSSYSQAPIADTYYVGDTFFGGGSGNVFNNTYALNYLPYYQDTITHEIGHGLGLGHPHDTWGSYAANGSNVTRPDTVMAYAAYDGASWNVPADETYSKPTTLMVTDIAAIQYMYGINEQYNSGDTTYMLGSFSDKNYIYASIWDAGGTDTFSWADQSSSAAINLTAGGYSFFGKITSQSDTDIDSVFGTGDGLLGIAYGATIENAIGGSASDTIVGNSAANTLYGGTGAGVKDTLTGNGGADIFVCSLSDATTDLSVADIISDFTDGSDKIGLEDRTFSNLTISNATGDFTGDTQIVDTSSNKVLFLLDGINAGLIDENDFVVTDFV
jgi:hypothetical protein